MTRMRRIVPALLAAAAAPAWAGEQGDRSR